MSYDIEFGVKVDTNGGDDLFVGFATPELDSPTYNIGPILRAATGWDFKQGEWYRYVDVEPLILHGIEELTTNIGAYKHMEPENGWGTAKGALRVLRGLVDDARGHADDDNWERYPKVPLECIYIIW